IAGLLAAITVAALIAMVAITNYEVLARYVFGRPSVWSIDVTYFLNSTLFLLAAAYALRERQHITIDIFSARLAPRARALVLSLFYLILFLPLLAALTFVAGKQSWRAWVTGQRILESAWRPPFWPFYLVVVLGMGALAVQVIAYLSRHLLVLAGRAGEADTGIGEGNRHD